MTEPIRVLYGIDSLGWAGTEKQLLELIGSFDRRRVQPHLFTLKPSPIAPADIDCPWLELPFTSLAAPGVFRCARRLSRFIAENRIQLVQTFFQDPPLVAFLATRFRRVQLLGSFRDLGFWREWKKVLQLRLVYPFFDGFIANSEAVADHFHRADWIPRRKIAVVYNGIPPAKPMRLDPDLAQWAEGAPLVGLVANLNRPVKRADLFIDAAALVHRDLPAAKFVLVGGGHLRPELEQRVSARGLSAVVRFTGNVPQSQAFIQGFSVGVLCSDSEGLSNALLEYMASGVPAVATAVGGNPEVLEDAVSGLLVPPNNPPALADAILRLLRDRDLSSRLAAAGRARVADRFSWEGCRERYETLYARVLGLSSSAPSGTRPA